MLEFRLISIEVAVVEFVAVAVEFRALDDLATFLEVISILASVVVMLHFHLLVGI